MEEKLIAQQALEERKEALLKALASLRRVLIKISSSNKDKELYEELRDSVIKRFEYSIDTFWKYIKEFLEIDQMLIIKTGSPKLVLRQASNVKLISPEEFEQLLAMIDDRNLTSHTYNEILAENISQRITSHHTLLKKIVDRIQKNKKLGLL